MPSQEDYLDNLLKGLDGTIPNDFEDEIEETMEEPIDFSVAEIQEMLENSVSEESEKNIIAEESVNDDYNPLGVEDTLSMSEDEIERLLAESEENATMPEAVVNQSEKSDSDSISDLLDMLSASDEEDLLELHDLLEKDGNDEAISEDIIALLQDDPIEEQNLMEDILGGTDDENASEEIGALLINEKEEKNKERQRIRDEKRAEKLAAREAKKAMQETNRMLRMEAKSAKEAEKKAQKEALAEEKRLAKEAKKQAQMQPKEKPADSVILENAGLEADFFATENTGESISSEMPVLDESIFGEQLQEADIFGDLHEVKEDDLSDIEALLNLSGGNEATETESEPEKPKVASKEKDTKEDKPRKKKAISRLMDFLTEAADDEVDEDNENIQLSEENKAIIEEMDKGKKKKRKDKKNKKDKKGEEDSSENGEESEEGEEEKPKKAKKEKKPKKEKIPKEMLEQIDGTAKPDKKLSFKKVLPIMLVCLSIGVVIIVFSNLAGDYAVKRAAREAFYEEDYQTCYQNLYGKELTETEQVMYGKSESILRIRLWIREYELLAQEGAEAEALDSLIQSVNEYPTLDAYAVLWNADSEVNLLYAQILGILEDKYHLTEEQALEIASQRSDVDYSMMIYAIIDGEKFGSWEDIEEGMEDLLPEEEEF